jgi:hypothetical protein
MMDNDKMTFLFYESNLVYKIFSLFRYYNKTFKNDWLTFFSELLPEKNIFCVRLDSLDLTSKIVKTLE